MLPQIYPCALQMESQSTLNEVSLTKIGPCDHLTWDKLGLERSLGSLDSRPSLTHPLVQDKHILLLCLLVWFILSIKMPWSRFSFLCDLTMDIRKINREKYFRMCIYSSISCLPLSNSY